MNIALIVAMDKNRLIGSHNQLPWHLPADLKYFRTVTMGKPIIMGRKTYNSIGKPLRGRRNIVLSRDKNLIIDQIETVDNLKKAITLGEGTDEVMIIGGSTVYKIALPFINKLYVTYIDAEFSGDTYFPDMNLNEWEVISREQHKPDERNIYPYEFVVYQKKSS